MKLFPAIAILLLSFSAKAQQVQPGFDIEEYKEMLKISARQVDTPWTEKNMKTSAPQHYDFVYRSPIVGLDNMWDLWVHKGNTKIAVLSLRGTTAKPVSWLENFYAAMIPAKGHLQLSQTERFDYEMAQDPKAAVHVGWVLGMAYLSKNILRKVDSLHTQGYHDFIIMGHSQGAALAYMLRSHIDYLQRTGKLATDLRFKTYNSAAPKPGNLYYAYEYERLTRNGWAFTVLNAADWVPETPMSLQTLDDFNNVNPFVNAGDMLGSQKFPKNIVLKLVYNSMRKPSYKLLKRYKRYMGDEAYKMVNKTLPDYTAAELYNSNNYMRAGSPIILMGDEDYKRKFPDSKDKIFVHHFPAAYLYLAEHY